MSSTAVTRYGRWIFALWICFSGCAGLRHSSKPIHSIPSFRLLQQIRMNASRLRTFQGSGRLSMVSVEGGFRGTIQVRSRTPDSLWMKVEGPLGIDVMRGVMGRDHVTMYYPREGLVYTGKLDRMRERGLLPVPMGLDAPVLSVLGLLVPQGTPTADVMHDGMRVLRFQTGEIVWIGSGGPVVTRAQYRDSENRPVWEWEAQKFRKRGKVLLPLIVRMTQIDANRRVTLFFESIRVNRKPRKDWFSLSIPEGVETIVF